MRESTRLQQGSPSRDRFKRKHKEGPGWCYACDVDFALVSKSPPGIVAFLDYQVGEEAISFSEVLAYNELLSIAPVFIVRGDADANGPFSVMEYEGGDYRPEPPRAKLTRIASQLDWQGLLAWEQLIRNGYAAQRGQP